MTYHNKEDINFEFTKLEFPHILYNSNINFVPEFIKYSLHNDRTENNSYLKF
jgi:hypothetical protein